MVGHCRFLTSLTSLTCLSVSASGWFPTWEGLCFSQHSSLKLESYGADSILSFGSLHLNLHRVRPVSRLLLHLPFSSCSSPSQSHTATHFQKHTRPPFDHLSSTIKTNTHHEHKPPRIFRRQRDASNIPPLLQHLIFRSQTHTPYPAPCPQQFLTEPSQHSNKKSQDWEILR